MYESIYIYNGDNVSYTTGTGVINTWADWHLISEKRPVVAPAKRKQNFIDVAGGNSSINISNLLTNGVNMYEDREGEFTFYLPVKSSENHGILNPVPDDRTQYDLDVLLNNISAFFNETSNFRCILESDYLGTYQYTKTVSDRSDLTSKNYIPMYVGDMWVESIDIVSDGGRSSITIGYRFEPYWIAAEKILLHGDELDNYPTFVPHKVSATYRNITKYGVDNPGLNEYDDPNVEIVTPSSGIPYSIINITDFIKDLIYPDNVTSSYRMTMPVNITFTFVSKPIRDNADVYYLVDGDDASGTNNSRYLWKTTPKVEYDDVDNNDKNNHGLLGTPILSYMNTYNKNNPRPSGAPTTEEGTPVALWYVGLHEMDKIILENPELYGQYYPGLLITSKDLYYNGSLTDIKIKVTNGVISNGAWHEKEYKMVNDNGTNNPFRLYLIVTAYQGGL